MPIIRLFLKLGSLYQTVVAYISVFIRQADLIAKTSIFCTRKTFLKTRHRFLTLTHLSLHCVHFEKVKIVNLRNSFATSS